MLGDVSTVLSPTAMVWLITGCSTGFGRTLVPAILARGDNVIATARKLSDLSYVDNLKGAKALQLDVTATEDVIREKLEAAMILFGRIDVLVNNAGYVMSGVWEEVSHEDTLRQFETNVFGALKLTRVLLPCMRSQKSGTILFMSSISGWHGVGAGGPYTSSKFALEGAAECLHQETKHLGIRTHLLEIGQFRTNILNSNKKIDKLGPGIVDYEPVKQNLVDRHTATNGSQPGNPELAAERIIDLVRGENMTASKFRNLPLRIPFGSDAVEVIRRKCTETLTIMDEWEEFASSTDFRTKEELPSYYQV